MDLKKKEESNIYQIKKSTHGSMQSSILWYDTFKGCLEKLGFKLNNYDPCVTKK